MSNTTQAVTRIEEITLEINSKLDFIQKESVSVGSLLKEAKEEMTEQNKTYAEFLAYCSDEFNIGKAQVSKLMKVASVFHDDTRFTGVAMRVLYTLACNATDEQMERAADFAATGSLNTAIVNQLLNPQPAKVEQVAEVLTDKEDTELQDSITDAINNVPERVTKEPQATVTTEDTSVLANELQEVRLALEAANNLIKELQSATVKHNTSYEMPMLPQFKNSCPCAVLGLSQDESTKITAIKKAFRELIKCGYGSGHKAFDLLATAKDTLLANI